MNIDKYDVELAISLKDAVRYCTYSLNETEEASVHGGHQG